MSNSNIVTGFYGGSGRNTILAQTLASATETEFKVGTDSGSTTTIAVLSMPVQSAITGSQTPFDQTVNPANLDTGFGRLTVPGVPPNSFNSGVFDNCKPFTVRLAGTYTPLTGASSVSITFKLYLGTSKSGTNLATTGAVANTNAAGASYGFLIEAQLKWDSLSQAVRGQFWYDVDGTTPAYHVNQALSANGSSVTAVSGLTFVGSAQWGGSNGGTVNVSEFSITQL